MIKIEENDFLRFQRTKRINYQMTLSKKKKKRYT